MSTRRPFVLVAATLAAGCGASFPPETLVDSLRVLAVTAEPPEIAPGEPTALSVLYSDPSRVGGASTVLWVGCEPDPQDLGRSPCNDATILLQPTKISDYPQGLQLLGFGTRASYKSTPGVFDVLEAANPIRQSGTIGQVMALVVGEEVDPSATAQKLRGYFERIEKKETQAVVALTRVLVSQKPQAERNANPPVGRLKVGGAPLPVGARLMLEAGATVDLSVDVPASAAQTFVEQRPTGPVTRSEKVVGAWYSTRGRFDRERFDVTGNPVTRFTAPGSAQFPDDTVPDRRTGSVWLVVRDDRGGQTFATYSFFVCDPSAPTPTITQATVSGDDVVVTGERLEAVLDVMVGDAALVRGAYDSVRQAFVGQRPAGVSGRVAVTATTRRCQTLKPPLELTLP